jgi:probable F420-dependent oxidoreductase
MSQPSSVRQQATGRPKLGVHPAVTDQSMPLMAIAKESQARAMESFFLPEHTHIPASRRTPYPEGGEIPERYKRVIDPFIGLAFVAAETDMEIGTCMSLPGQHDPIALAKAIATLDLLSGGRFVFGVGFGWNVEEFESHNPVSGWNRWEVVREKVSLMKALWQDDIASFEGEFVRLEPSWSWPKPVQRPHPPVLIGGGATPAARSRTFARVAGWGDGWIAVHGVLLEDGFDRDMAELRSVWESAGRDPAGLQVQALVQPAPVETLTRVLDTAAREGVDGLLLHLESRTNDEIMRALDDFALLLANA